MRLSHRSTTIFLFVSQRFKTRKTTEVPAIYTIKIPFELGRRTPTHNRLKLSSLIRAPVKIRCERRRWSFSLFPPTRSKEKRKILKRQTMNESEWMRQEEIYFSFWCGIITRTLWRPKLDGFSMSSVKEVLLFVVRFMGKVVRVGVKLSRTTIFLRWWKSHQERNEEWERENENECFISS